MKMKELWEEKRRKEGHDEDWEGEVCGAQWEGPESPVTQGESLPKDTVQEVLALVSELVYLGLVLNPRDSFQN